MSSVIVAGAGAAAGELPGAAGVLHVHLRVPVDPGARHRRHAPRHGLQLLHGEHHLNSDRAFSVITNLRMELFQALVFTSVYKQKLTQESSLMTLQ